MEILQTAVTEWQSANFYGSLLPIIFVTFVLSHHMEAHGVCVTEKLKSGVERHTERHQPAVGKMNFKLHAGRY